MGFLLVKTNSSLSEFEEGEKQYNYTDTSLINSFNNSIFINENQLNEDLFNNSKNILVMNQKMGEKIINKMIFHYIPKGPIFNKYVFIPRLKEL